MQKKDFMFEAISYAAEEYLISSEIRRKVRVKTVKKKSTPKTVATVAVIIIGILLVGVASDSWVLRKYEDVGHNKVMEKVSGEITEVYEYVEYDGKVYEFSKEIEDLNLKAMKVINTAIKVNNKEIEADVYKVGNVKEICFVALKKDDKMYIYNNIEYNPKTLKELFEDYGIDENVVFSEIIITGKNETVYHNYDSKVLFDRILLDDKELIDDMDIKEKRIVFKTYNHLEIDDIDICIDEDGNGYIMFFREQKYIDFGKKVYEDLLEYLENN
ncbi:MAG: hypothetical protein E7266_00490 [Lachnospiraceae bacterium]|nr:hypothetical protein [Lachnospiraceae bacterium]